MRPLDGVPEAATLAERFSAERIAPRYFETSDKSALLGELAALGFCGFVVPEEDGGSGIGLGPCLAALEAIARSDPQLAYQLAGINFGIALPIARFGSPDQKRRLRDLLRLEAIGALAHTEPDGAAFDQIRTRATRRGGGWVLSGRKSFVSSATSCDLLLVTARTGPASDARRALSVFLVDRRATTRISVGQPELTVGMQNLRVADVFLDDVELDAADLLGPEGGAADVLTECMDHMRLGVTAIAIGGARRVVAELKDACARRRIGAAPMAAHPPVRERLTSMLADVRSATWALEGAAASFRSGDRLQRMADSIVCKTRVTALVQVLCASASELMGSAGYLENDIVERLQRDLRVLTLLAGPNQALHGLLSDLWLPIRHPDYPEA